LLTASITEGLRRVFVLVGVTGFIAGALSPDPLSRSRSAHTSSRGR
jgi:hypothetical protein